LITQDLQAAK